MSKAQEWAQSQDFTYPNGRLWDDVKIAVEGFTAGYEYRQTEIDNLLDALGNSDNAISDQAAYIEKLETELQKAKNYLALSDAVKEARLEGARMGFEAARAIQFDDGHKEDASEYYEMGDIAYETVEDYIATLREKK